MKGSHFLAAMGLVSCLWATMSCSGLARAGRHAGTHHDPASNSKTIGGFKVQLVAVNQALPGGQKRMADHSWTPDGFPYEGPEARLAMRAFAGKTGGDSSRYFYFELETPKPEAQITSSPQPASNVDVYAYLPNAGDSKDDTAENPSAAGPTTVEIWRGLSKDSAGTIILPAPASVVFGLEGKGTEPQPVSFGVAQGNWAVIARGAASMADIAENQTGIVASGSWGRIEATRLPRPMAESKPSPTHRFRLLGGQFPPKAERKVFFYDAKGVQIATCGDGPNNPGSAGPAFFSGGAPSNLARFEIRERPYEFVQFDDVSLDAPHFTAHSENEGFQHAANSSVGKVVGLLKSTKDGAWSGTELYAADGIRWIDPGGELTGYEYGQFDPWNHPLNPNFNILLEPAPELSQSSAPVTCDIYAADAADGPNKEKLTLWNEAPFRSPITQIGCKPTACPYLRIEVRAGQGVWKTVETIPVDAKMLAASDKVSFGSRILEVFFDDDGSIRIWKDEPNPVTSAVKLHPGEQRFRAVARLRDGRTVDVDLNMSGSGGSPPNERRYRGLEFTRQSNGTHVQSGFGILDIKSIAAFELQVQDMRAAVVIPVHTPNK